MSEPSIEEKLIYIFKKAGEGIFLDELNDEGSLSYDTFKKYLSNVFELLVKTFKE